MNHSKLPIDNAQWKRIGRRRFTMLAILLSINVSLVVLGVNSQLNRASIAAAATLANDSQKLADSTEPAPTTGDQQATVTPNHSSSPPQVENPVAAISEVPIADSQPQVARQIAEPTGAIPSLPPNAAAPTPAEESIVSEQFHLDSFKTSPKTQYSSDDFGQGAADDTSQLLTIINPPSTRGTVHYLIAGNLHSLSPGEYHRLEGGSVRQIQFHQGDDLGDTERALSSGFFVFSVGNDGWELVERPADIGRRLLRTCRSIKAEK